KDREAVDFWNQAVMRRPRFPEANFMLGEALRKNKQIRDSVQFYERALDQDPSQFAYYARLGGVYIALRESDRAFKIFSQGLERFAKLPEAHYFVAISARARGDYDLAESELRQSLALAPANVNALAQLGFILLERDRLTEAEATLRQAIALNDKHFYANYDLGRLLVKSHRYESALPILQRAATLKPNNSSVHYQLFMALSRLKRKDEADRELATFKQLDEARKARPLEGELDDDEVQNPPASPSPAPT
ncbi:MAG TPA: tetratricopeptide repeat protein, partial [Pyrinomonadaceae bacterium]|nr:tetratricopeptide repeat protein [Pyrinomonadaceae bacterium]